MEAFGLIQEYFGVASSGEDVSLEIPVGNVNEFSRLIQKFFNEF